jgi:hypothetical protein
MASVCTEQLGRFALCSWVLLSLGRRVLWTLQLAKCNCTQLDKSLGSSPRKASRSILILCDLLMQVLTCL